MLPRRDNDSLEEWDTFVLRHRNMKNVALHFASALMFWLGPILGILVSPYYFLLFFASGIVGSVGHYIFDDGGVNVKEATSSVKVVVFSSLMAWLFVSGSYPSEIRRVLEKNLKLSSRSEA